MLLRLTARVESAAIVEEPFGVEVPPYSVDLGCDEHNRVTEIRVEKRVAASDTQLPRTTISPSGEVTFHVMTSDPHFRDILDLLQFIESIGSFHLGIRSVEWSHGKYEWVPETDDERQQLRLFSTQTTFKYRQTPVNVDPGTLARLVNSRTRLERFTIPMAFFREGVNDFRRFRYVQAFHNLYFFLEDLFGGGKTKNRQVEAQFLSDAILQKAVTETLVALEGADLTRHRMNLEGFFKVENAAWTPNGVVSFIVGMRGNLHHYSQKSTKPKGHPLNQREFESVAFLLQMICYRVVAKLVR